MRRALPFVALTALALPAPAFAHATLGHTSPGFRQRLERAPAQVRLEFDQGVKAFPDSIEVRNAKGTLVSGSARSAGTLRQAVVVPVRRLPKGFYTVRWHAMSADGHVVAGVYTFGVRFAAPPPTESYGASGPTTSEHVVRWAYFVALALLLGGLGFRLLVVRGPLPRRAERRFYAVTGAGAIAVLEVGIVAFLLRAEDALQLPFGQLLYGDLSPIAGGTRFGTAFIAMTLGFALVSALLYLAWLTDRMVLLWPAFLVGLGFASGLSLSGHSAADAGSSVFSELADWLHLTAATLWIGGLVQLAAVVWPAAPELRRTAFLRFSRLATVLVAILVVAGIYLSILRLPHVHDLWTAGYGRVLLVKLALVSVALAWGGLHKLVALPAVERGEGRVLARLPRSLAGESAVAMAVLLAAAVLVDSKPPPRPAAPASAKPPAARAP
jgi:copper transport protein